MGASRAPEQRGQIKAADQIPITLEGFQRFCKSALLYTLYAVIAAVLLARKHNVECLPKAHSFLEIQKSNLGLQPLAE